MKKFQFLSGILMFLIGVVSLDYYVRRIINSISDNTENCIGILVSFIFSVLGAFIFHKSFKD